MVFSTKALIAASAVIACLLALGLMRDRLSVARAYLVTRLGERKTVEDRLRELAEPVAQRLSPDFARAGVAYPPGHLALLAFKDTRIVELYAGASPDRLVFIKRYPILAASGNPGPKLREGDRQVPEGLYFVESLNPNSLYHLSMRLNYPNAFDREQAAREGRTGLGGDIMIHGSNLSIGCLAIGDPAAEELFILAAHAGVENVRVLISPTDFRNQPPDGAPPPEPDWVAGLYNDLRTALRDFPQHP